MTDRRMALVELRRETGEGDFRRSVAEALLQILMEADGSGPPESVPARLIGWDRGSILRDGAPRLLRMRLRI